MWIEKTTFCSSWRFVDEIPLWADDDSGTCGMIKCNNFPRSWISVGNETFLRSWEMGWGRDNHFTKQLTNGAKLSGTLNKKGQVEILSKEMEMFWRESEKSRKSWWLFRANFYDFHDLGITWQLSPTLEQIYTQRWKLVFKNWILFQCAISENLKYFESKYYFKMLHEIRAI